MERAQLMLKKAGKRLNVVGKQSRSWLMLWVVLFGLGLFFVVYVLKKLHRLGKMVF